MPIIDLYSKRKKAAERSDQPEIYQYTDFPIQFRRQVIYIWISAIGNYEGRDKPLLNNLWQAIYSVLARELGLFELTPKIRGIASNPFEQYKSFLLDQDTHIDNLLDLIEITFKYIEQVIPNLLNEYRYQGIELFQTSDQAIYELNHRFREHEIGYQYENGQIIRVDSHFIHSEAVIPALTLISDEGFIGTEQEFRSAHKHYRNQEYKAAIVESLKAFESTMKTICDKFSWAYDKTATASKLIDVVLKEELILSTFKTI